MEEKEIEHGFSQNALAVDNQRQIIEIEKQRLRKELEVTKKSRSEREEVIGWREKSRHQSKRHIKSTQPEV